MIGQTYLRTGLSMALGSLLLVGTSQASAAEYECYKATTTGGWVKTRKPKGNWGPQHDTRKWKYDPVPGGDIYRHRRGKRTVGTRCKGLGYNFGTLKIDFEGYQDWCANYVAGSSGSIVTPTCGSGYSLSADKSMCTKPATSGFWQKNRKPRGNWGPQHDTRKWNYDPVPGGDIYRHRRGKRTVGTRCKGLGYNFGTLKIDFEGYQDWCATYINGTSASTVSASCPTGHQLRVKPTGGLAIKPAKALKNSGIEQIHRPKTFQKF